MPTTKYIYLKILFSIFLLSVFFSCDQQKSEKSAISKNPREITFIGLSNIGGSNGYYRIIKVTKDSITAEKGTTSNKMHKAWASAISPDTWKQLSSSIRVEDLDHIKSSPSQQSVDRTDEAFQIRTPKKAHIYINSFVDTIHYKQFQQLKEQLDKILPKEYK
ncbi:hypothetical protein [Chryseobacterium sp. BIGb0232]|uniref:hypothetical protein n=1 Tax=Chryseobacterium sp. BIGb0232 TaxID=2940598 RepID=UPI000F4847ED|nr:hypothetical protein [Chryseobacterium sp. BIGb0232]MCS4303515.1 GTP-binding protein EngB required for normal cell division [Chryseobacterium sp. BIGb0232]ROS11214.1 hypothetical protein EDF65_3618 [Chryseobacterium nakagawai]